MSAAQNLVYSAIQVAHNFGAVAVVGGSFIGALLKNPGARKNLAWLVLAGWGVQAVSGAAFGAATYYFAGKFPDIGDIATAALMLKMTCVMSGFILLSAYLYWGPRWTDKRCNWVWVASSALAITALSAAAVLRWFS